MPTFDYVFRKKGNINELIKTKISFHPTGQSTFTKSIIKERTQFKVLQREYYSSIRIQNFLRKNEVPCTKKKCPKFIPWDFSLKTLILFDLKGESPEQGIKRDWFRPVRNMISDSFY